MGDGDRDKDAPHLEIYLRPNKFSLRVLCFKSAGNRENICQTKRENILTKLIEIFWRGGGACLCSVTVSEAAIVTSLNFHSVMRNHA